MVESKDRQLILLRDIEEDAEISAACYIGHVESQAVINLIQKQSDDDGDDDTHQSALNHKEDDEVASVLHTVNPLLNDDTLYEMLSNRKELSEFHIAIGSTNASASKYIIPDDVHTSDETPTNLDCIDEDTLLTSIINESNTETFDIDDTMVSAFYTGHHHGVQAKHLAKLWRIDEHTAKKTLAITSQRSVRTYNPKLS